MLRGYFLLLLRRIAPANVGPLERGREEKGRRELCAGVAMWAS